MDNAPIYVEVTFNSQRARYYPGFNIASSQWDKDSQSVIRKCNGKTYMNACGQTADIINAYLMRVRVVVDTIFERYEYENKIPHPQYLLDDIRAELNNDKKIVERKTIFDYYDMFISDKLADGIRISRKKNYITRRNQLEEYGKLLYFEDFTKSKMSDFVNWLSNEKGYINDYVLKIIQDIKVFLSWAYDNGYNNYDEYKRFKKKFGDNVSKGKNIFALNKEEVVHLYTMDIKQDYLSRVRDVFVFCCFTGLRYSDIDNLRWSNIHDDCIQFVTIKTSDALVVQLNDVSRALIEKYRPMRGIYADDKVFPVISNQKYNKYLKELGRLAGFNRVATWTTFSGGQRKDQNFHLYELITTHTARKTFVSIAASLGIPGNIIRSYTGHKSPTAMKPYEYLYNDDKILEMSKMNTIISRESVFDYAITDDERNAMGIPERDQYEPIIKKDRNLGLLHIALLMQKRGDAVKSLEYVSKLPDAMKVQYMQTITNAK